MLNEVRVVNREPLTIVTKELRIILCEDSISVFCERHKRILIFSPTPIMGVSMRSHFKISKSDEYLIEAKCISVSDEFVTNLSLIILATGSITLVSKVRPIKRLIPLNIITPHLKIYFKDFMWRVKTSLVTVNESTLFKGDTLPVENANVALLSNDNCTFSIFVGRGILSIGSKHVLLYPKIYFRKYSSSSLSLGLSYSNLPSLTLFEILSSLTIHHAHYSTIKNNFRKESIFYDVDFNIADALEPIKVTAYQKIVDNDLYFCPLLRVLSELMEEPSCDKLYRITLIELIEIISSLVSKYPYILYEGMELVKRYLDKIAFGRSDQVLRYIEGLIKDDEKTIVDLAKSLVKEIMDTIQLYDPMSLFAILEMLPLIMYPTAHIVNEISPSITSAFNDIITFVKQKSLSNLGKKSTYLRFLVLQSYIGAELIKHSLKAKNDLKVYVRELMRMWNELDEAFKLISAGFSTIIQFKSPMIFPLINNFKAVYLLPLDRNVKAFLVALKEPHERIKLYVSPVRRVKVKVFDEFGEMLCETMKGHLKGSTIEVYLPPEQSEYFIMEVLTSP